MKNKNIIVSLVSGAVLAVTLLAICLGFIMGELACKKRELENTYQSAFYSFCEDINLLETDLAKLEVGNESVESIPLILNTKTHAQGALDAYLCLPLEFSSENAGTVKFLNQVVDWCDSYTISVANGQKSNKKEDAKKLYSCAKEIAYNLSEVAKQGKLTKTTDNTLLSSSLVDINTISSFDLEYTTLIYDGPFSDREEVMAKAIENKKKISETQAKEIAMQSLNMEQVQVLGKSGGATVCYEISGKVEDSDAYALITEKGGFVSLFLANLPSLNTDETMSEEYCEKNAKAMLEKLGYHNMQVVWKNRESDQICFNFAPVIKDITYYTDLVKIRVCLSSGKVEGVESSDYISSFAPRNYTPRITKEQALSKVDLEEKEGVRLCVIPHLNGEIFCYEINGKYNGEKYYVYIDAKSGKQCQVLKVIGTNQGETVM